MSQLAQDEYGQTIRKKHAVVQVEQLENPKRWILQTQTIAIASWRGIACMHKIYLSRISCKVTKRML